MTRAEKKAKAAQLKAARISTWSTNLKERLSRMSFTEAWVETCMDLQLLVENKPQEKTAIYEAWREFKQYIEAAIKEAKENGNPPKQD